MRLRILGTNSDERGCELERLASRLLSRKGYRQVTTNLVGSGGNELDIVAEFPVPGLGTSQPVTIIGECKAHEAPIAMSDWLKFLGKVATEQWKPQATVRGLLIALSGVNGNVAGAYNDLRKTMSTIELVSGDALRDMVASEFSVVAADQVAVHVSRSTPMAVVEISLAYYREHAYWLVVFSDDTFTLLDASHLDQPVPPATIDAVQYVKSLKSFRDLSAEAQSKQRQAVASKCLLALLLIHRSGLTFPKACEEIAKIEATVQSQDVGVALDRLRSMSLVSEDDGGLLSLANVVDNLELRLSFLLEFTDTFVITLPFATTQWDALIDERLIAIISAVQAGLPIPEELNGELLSLLRWSPTALAHAIRPDPMIVIHRQNPSQPQVDDDDRRYLRVQLLRWAITDFQSGPFKALHFERFGLREVEFQRRAIFKGGSGPLLEVDIAERMIVARVAPDIGTGYALVWGAAAAPEPWNWPKSAQNETTVSTGASSETEGRSAESVS